jgi:hypothetical protein
MKRMLLLERWRLAGWPDGVPRRHPFGRSTAHDPAKRVAARDATKPAGWKPAFRQASGPWNVM